MKAVSVEYKPPALYFLPTCMHICRYIVSDVRPPTFSSLPFPFFLSKFSSLAASKTPSRGQRNSRRYSTQNIKYAVEIFHR